MLSYVTPAKARLMGLGLGTISDTDLRAALNRASRRVNAFCATANRPQPHDFRGGTITNEKRQWRLPRNEVDPGQAINHVYHWPLIDVTECRIYVSKTQYVEFQASELMLTDRYFEIVSLAFTSAGLFGGGIGPIIGAQNPVIQYSYTYGETFQAVGEELVTDNDSDTRFRAENQWWTSEDDVTVYINGVAQALPTVDLDEGTVTFPLPVVGTVTADYSYRLDPDIAEATGILLGQEFDLSDLRSKGLTGLQRVRVGEIELERASRGSGSANADPTYIPESARLLLAGRAALWAGA